MQWNSDPSVGDWLKPRIDDPWRATMHDAVPRGFEAYARVFHPVTKSRPIGRDWPAGTFDSNRRAWEAFAEAGVEVETVAARWSDAATAFGTTMHPLAQWGALVGARGDDWNPSDWRQVTSPDGWQFDAPSEGELDAASLAVLVRVLLDSAADAHGSAAVWEGYGGLLGHLGETPSRAFFTMTTDEHQDADTVRHGDVLGTLRSDPFNNPYRKATWQPGILSDEISTADRFELPGRAYVVFDGALDTFADEDWQLRVPWRDTVAEAHGFAPRAQSPNLMWPADASWCVVSEIDWDSTIVAGSRSAIDRVLAESSLESTELAAEASLQWDADEVNR